MRKDLISFATGLATGVVLGLLVKDKYKRMIQETLVNQLDLLRKKYEELNASGKELLQEGLNKAKDIKKDYL